MKKTRVAVAGASGYSGQELLKLLKRHGSFEVVKLLGRENSGRDSLDSLINGQTKDFELAFLCTPAETSLAMATHLIELGVHVVDVSGAFRLKKFSYPEWYGFEHGAPALLTAAEYGLYPWKKLSPVKAGAPARLVANPGCFATAVLMGLIPLLKSGLVRKDPLFIDAKSGTTGAGRKAETRLLFSEIDGEMAPYRIGKHQHWPEIVESIESHAGVSVHPTFVTELLPVSRGISVAIFAEWAQGPAFAKLLAFMQESYAGNDDILVSAEPSTASLKAVVGTNRVHLQVNEAYGKPLLFVTIDNLLRGAAGQALINANLLMGFDTRQGLWE